jgi:hypothetical protein
MWWRILSVCGGGVGWLRWSGKSTTPWEASLRWVGAPEPAKEERGRLVWSGDGEPVAETRVVEHNGTLLIQVRAQVKLWQYFQFLCV